MDYLNKRKFEISNIIEWHKVGFKGKGVRIAIMDKNFDTTSPIFHGKVTPVRELGYKNGEGTSHGSAVAHVIHQIAPESNIFVIPPSTESIIWCIENDIDIINVSMGLIKYDGFVEASKLAIKRGIKLFTSAGNYEESVSLSYPAPLQEWISVGAVHNKYEGTSRESIIRADYSSYTKKNKEIWEMVECMGFAGVNILSPKNTTRPFDFLGTSCACPYVAGMVALLTQYKKMSQQEIRELIYKNCIDLEDKDFDRFTGYGLFILPKLEDIENKNEDYHNELKSMLKPNEQMKEITDKYGDKYKLVRDDNGKVRIYNKHIQEVIVG